MLRILAYLSVGASARNVMGLCHLAISQIYAGMSTSVPLLIDDISGHQVVFAFIVQIIPYFRVFAAMRDNTVQASGVIGIHACYPDHRTYEHIA